MDRVVHAAQDGVSRRAPCDTTTRPKLDLGNGRMLYLHLVLPGSFGMNTEGPSNCRIYSPRMRNDGDSLLGVSLYDFIAEG